MKMRSSYVLALIFLLATCIFSAPAWPTAQSDSQLSAESALFERFETVFFAKSEILYTPEANAQLSAGDAGRLRTPFGYLMRALDSLQDSASAEILASSSAVLVGAKDFRAPTGLGAVHSKLCYIVILGKSSDLDTRKYFNKLLTTATAGLNIWNWSADLREFGEGDSRPSSLFATQISRSYLIVSNDIAELTEIAGQLNSPKNNPKILEAMHGWGSVNQHEFWGYRRYRHNGIVDRTAAGMTEVTPGTEALFFYLDTTQKRAVVGVLGSPNVAATAKNINATGGLPRLAQRGPGRWESVIPLSGTEKSYDQVFGVMGLFGFAIYL
jgi:hypothetical protein